MKKDLKDLLKEVANSKEFKEFMEANKDVNMGKAAEDELVENIKTIYSALLLLMETRVIKKIDCERISIHLCRALLITLNCCAKHNGKTTSGNDAVEKIKMFQSTIDALFGVDVSKDVN